MIILIGGRGRLGEALLRSYDGMAVALDRAVYENWWRASTIDQIRDVLLSPELGATAVVVASGILDPRAEPELIQRVNFDLPNNIISALHGSGVHVMTMGTVMEVLMSNKNAYVASKAALSDRASRIKENVTHVRIHTLYGGAAPSPSMFLGQMVRALSDGVQFAMTSGEQLREYHHVDDAAQAIRIFLNAREPGIVDLSYGNPIKLRILAEAIFSAFGRRDLLKIGAISQPIEENYGKIFETNNDIAHLNFRDPISGVINYLQSYSASYLMDRSK